MKPGDEVLGNNDFALDIGGINPDNAPIVWGELKPILNPLRKVSH